MELWALLHSFCLVATIRIGCCHHPRVAYVSEVVLGSLNLKDARTVWSLDSNVVVQLRRGGLLSEGLAFGCNEESCI